MKLNELLPDIGRPVAYYPALARALESVNAALLLCQLIYWFGKEADPDLGIYKTKAELTEETGLSEYEQDAATAKLVQLGLLTMTYRRLQHRMYYLLHINALNDFWANYQVSPNREKSGSGTGKNQVPEPENSQFPNREKSGSTKKMKSRTGENQVPEPGIFRFGNRGKSGSGTGKNQIRSLSAQEITPETTNGEHTPEMAQVGVEIADLFNIWEGWLQRVDAPATAKPDR